MPEPGDDRARRHGQADVAVGGRQQGQPDRGERRDEQDDVDEADELPGVPRDLDVDDREPVMPTLALRPNQLKMNMIRIRRTRIHPRSSRPD